MIFGNFEKSCVPGPRGLRTSSTTGQRDSGGAVLISGGHSTDSVRVEVGIGDVDGDGGDGDGVGDWVNVLLSHVKCSTHGHV